MKILAVSVIGIVAAAAAIGVASGAPGGHQGVVPAYYDAELFNITLRELPSNAEENLIDHNGSINIIYQSDECPDFISVIDAIQGDGFNPIWREVQITFNAGFSCHQFFSDDEILGAAESGEITLTPTDELYICSVFTPK